MRDNLHLDHETRQHQIIDAAREIIIEGGLASLTVKALATRVGVTVAALYRHVRSKEEVVLLMLTDVRRSLFDAVSGATESDRVALDKLEHLLRLHLSYVESRRGVSFVLLTEALQLGDSDANRAARALVEDYLSLVEAIVAEGQRSGELDPEADAASAAVMFFGMVQATVTRWLFDPAAYPLNERVEEIWRLFRSAVVLRAESVPPSPATAAKARPGRGASPPAPL